MVGARFNPPSVLLADDSHEFLLATALCLGAAGARTDTADSEMRACTLMRRNRYDLVAVSEAWYESLVSVATTSRPTRMVLLVDDERTASGAGAAAPCDPPPRGGPPRASAVTFIDRLYAAEELAALLDS